MVTLPLHVHNCFASHCDFLVELLRWWNIDFQSHELDWGCPNGLFQLWVRRLMGRWWFELLWISTRERLPGSECRSTTKWEIEGFLDIFEEFLLTIWSPILPIGVSTGSEMFLPPSTTLLSRNLNSGVFTSNRWSFLYVLMISPKINH